MPNSATRDTASVICNVCKLLQAQATERGKRNWGTVPPVECEILTLTLWALHGNIRPKVDGAPGWAEPFRPWLEKPGGPGGTFPSGSH